MEKQEKIIAIADIKRVPNRAKTIYFIIITGILIIGILCASYGGNGYYAIVFGLLLDCYLFHFGCSNSNGWEFYGFGHYFFPFLLSVSAFFGLPFFIDVIYNHMCKNTSLIVSETKIYGSNSNFLIKKRMEIPIEKIDNLTMKIGLMDKLYTGATLSIFSSSGVIKFHFVQNPEEIIDATMACIDKIKNPLTPEKTDVNSSFLSSEKLKELLVIKESGLISEEEYAKKREEILSQL